MLPQPKDITLTRLNARFGTAPAEAALAVALDRYEGQIALVSSFGAEAAVLLHMLSRIDAGIPILLLDTQLLFPETLSYQLHLTGHLGLKDVRRITPVETQDPDKSLHLTDTRTCCQLRKVEPVERALCGFDAVITGRKRFQTRERQKMECFEHHNGRVRINPLADWTANQIAWYFDTHDLPKHPLVAKNYLSIGCAPCTTKVAQGEAARSGRWRGQNREECGIHFGADGTLKRTTR